MRAMSDDAPKSAFELAMQRLRQKDKETDVDARPLTDAQKAAIAEGPAKFTRRKPPSARFSTRPRSARP